MKIKNKILTAFASLISATTSFMGVAITSNSNNQIGLNANVNPKTITKTFDAKLIGAQKGTFTVEYTDVNNCVMTKVDKHFLVKGNFNFNGGHFTCDGITYTITEIKHDMCIHIPGWYNYFFVESYITFPSTIKKIGDSAFKYNSSNGLIPWTKSEIMGINFEDGIEEIDEYAFAWCDDIKQDTLVLPNSVKRIKTDCFNFYSVHTLDLSALDHVIDIDNWAFYHNGFAGYVIPGVLTEWVFTVYVKDEAMKAKYLADPRWYSEGIGADKIKVK